MIWVLGAGCSNAVTTPAPAIPPANDARSSETPILVTPVLNSPSPTSSSVTPPATITSPVKPTTTSPTPTAPTPPPATPPTTSGLRTYTMAEVGAANNAQKCWTAINGKVYDVTEWAKKHPGGAPNILKLCGMDGSNFFNGKHGGQENPEKTLTGMQIGVLKK